MPDSTNRLLKVFLCHASADKLTMRELYRQLDAEGWIDAWLDEIKLLPGQEWDIEIEKAVEEADVVIVCISNRSVDKEGYVQKELRYVLNIADEKSEGSIFVIPLRLDDCIVPRRLRPWQWVDYFPEDYKSIGYQRIMKSLRIRAARLGISAFQPGPNLHYMTSDAADPKDPELVAPNKPEAIEPGEEKQAERITDQHLNQTHYTPVKKKVLLNPKLRLLIGVTGVLILVPVSMMVAANHSINSLFELVTTTPTLFRTNTVDPAFTSGLTNSSPQVQTHAPTMTGSLVTTVIPTETPSLTFDYTVREGDTCAVLIAKFGVSFYSILAQNQLNSQCLISVGQTLKIPFPTPALGAAPTPRPTAFHDPDSTTIGKDGMTLLYIRAGEFTMGSDNGKPDEKPAHKVALNAFWIDETEVTNAMYAKCVDARVCKPPTKTTSKSHSAYYGSYYDNSIFVNFPVIYVDWNMATTYCEWVDRRLPTEAEWEKAARGTNGNVYPWGDTLFFSGARANLCDVSCPPNLYGSSPNLSINDGFNDTAPVGNYPYGASPYGVLDLAGNVWEWVNDWYEEYPGGDSNASSDFGQVFRVVRGGSFDDHKYYLRSAFRSYRLPDFSDSKIGFRCAVSATP